MTERQIVPDVFGIETEYTCLVVHPDGIVYESEGGCHSSNKRQEQLHDGPNSNGASHIKPKDIASALGDMDIYKTTSGMLSNGGRLYIDMSGPEYATPETTTAEEAVHRSFDGDDILLEIFGDLKKAGIIRDYQLNRRLVDHNRSSRGVHLNTTSGLPHLSNVDKDVVEALSTLNVAKGAMFGSGGLLLDRHGDTQFHHSPRLSITSCQAADFKQHTRRPLVRVPFKADGRQLSRIETVTGDALNFAWPLRASLVATNSLVRLLELRRDISIPYLLETEHAARTVGEYGHEGVIDVLYDGREGYSKEKSLTVLRNICEIILSTGEAEGILNGEARQVLPEIIEVADTMAKDPTSVAHLVESMARFLAMDRRKDKDGLRFNDDKMCQFDFAWDRLGGGVAETLRKRNFAGWYGFSEQYSPGETARRLNSAPSDTRAKARGQLIRATKGSVEVDWWGANELGYFPPTSTANWPHVLIEEI